MVKINSGIYGFKCSVNDKWYVGSSASIYHRKADHIRRLRRNQSDHPRLQNAWNKHGEEAFEWSVLEWVTLKENLVEREQHWIDALAGYSDGYNTQPIAKSNFGVVRSEATKQKLRELANKQVHPPRSDEHKAAISRAHTGKVVSEETRAKMRAAYYAKPPKGGTEAAAIANTGKTRSEETKAKQSASHMAARQNPEIITKWQNALDKMHEANRGRRHTPEARAKMSASQKARFAPP